MNDKPSQPISMKEIFFTASGMPSGEQREAYLQQVAGKDARLLQRLERMLADSESADPNRVDRALATFELPPDSEHNSPADIKKQRLQIGPYKLLHQLGDGGMGEVFVAEQRKPVERTVALKLIKRGMDSDEVIARFEAERQALAMMNHPNVAKVLDAGQSEDGRPYFVMDLVRGIPITEYCDQHKLDTRARMELLVNVCQAVQHAHLKGIIHRDLKPSNILVELHDVRHVPKVIDFGVAKAINQRLTEKTLFTQFAQMVGTPLYMSPEQAELSGMDVDIRSDVYALGVLLYEMLTGTTPFDREALKSAGFDEMRRIIREDDPPRPSQRISTLNEAQLFTLSERQQVPIPRLKRRIERELDWIVLKALEKDRTRRYESASALAADIQRYLDDEAVEACPPSIAYQVQKLSRRYRGLLWTSALVGSLLIVGFAVTGWQAIRIKQSGEAAQRAGETAMTNAAIATAVNKFLTEDLLGQADPSSEPDRNVRLRTVLDRAAQTVGGRFADQSLVEAAVRETLGDAYVGIGQGEKAREQFQRCIEIRSEQLGAEAPDTLKARHGVGKSLNMSRKFDEAEKELSDLIRIQKRVLGPDHIDTLASEHDLGWSIARRSVGHNETGTTVETRQNKQEAETLLRQVVVKRSQILGEEHPDTLHSRNSLAAMVMEQGRYADAEKLFRDLLIAQQKVLAENHPQVHYTMHNLAMTLAFQSQGKSEEGKQIHRDLLKRRRQLGANDHPHTLLVMRMVAGASYDTPEAGELFEEVLAIRRRVLGDEEDATIYSMYELAQWQFRQGDLEASRKTYRNALEISRQVTEGGPDFYNSPARLGDQMFKKGLYQDAEELFREGLRQCARHIGDSRWSVQRSRDLALAVFEQGRYVEAANIVLDAIRSNAKTVASKVPTVTKYIDWLTGNMHYYAWMLSTCADVSKRDPKKALELARALVKLRPERPNHWRNLGVALYRNGEWSKAVESFQKAGKILKDEDMVPHMFLAMAQLQLGNEELAKEIYAQGAAFIDIGHRNNKEQLRLRGEAEELMRLTEKDRKQLIADFYLTAERRHPWFFTARGIWHQNRGDYQLAFEDFRTAVDTKETDFAVRHIILLLLRQGKARDAIEELSDIDDLDASSFFLRNAAMYAYAAEESLYRQLCQRMLQKFADSDDLSDVERTCKVCSLLPGVIEPSKIPLMRLETSLDEDKVSLKNRHWLTLAQAMVRYRMGDSEKALAAIGETQSHEAYSQTPAIQPVVLALRAITQHKLGLLAEAKQTLAEATILIETSWPKLLNDEFRDGWPDWLLAETLRREADALLTSNKD